MSIQNNHTWKQSKNITNNILHNFYCCNVKCHHPTPIDDTKELGKIKTWIGLMMMLVNNDKSIFINKIKDIVMGDVRIRKFIEKQEIINNHYNHY
jgi:hypothetical protein